MTRARWGAWAAFAVGAGAGLGLARGLSLPFRNPHGVLSPLAEQGFNPATNVARYLVVLAGPIVALLALALARRVLGANGAGAPCGSSARRTPPEARPSVLVRVGVQLFACLCAVCVTTYHAEGTFDLFHEGLSFEPALAFMEGGAPYADTALWFGPVQGPLRVVLAFELFGPTIGAARALESLTKVAVFCLLAALLLRIFPRRPHHALCVLALIALAAVHGPRNGLIVMSRDVLPALFLLLVARASRGATESAGGHVSWGNTAALAFLPPVALGYSVDRGIMLCACGLFVVAALVIALPDRRRTVLLAAVAGLAAGTAVLAVLLRGELAAFVRFIEGSVLPLFELSLGIPYDLSRPEYLAPLLLIAALPFWTFVHFAGWNPGASPRERIRGFLRAHLLETTLVVTALVFYRGALGRADSEHVLYSLWPALLASAVIVLGHYLEPALEARKRAAILCDRVLAAAWIPVALWFLVFAVTRDRLVQNFPLRQQDRELLTRLQADVLDELREELGPGETFANLGEEPGWYYLVGRAAPTRYGYAGMAISLAQRRELLADLERARVDVVLVRDPDVQGIDKFPFRRRMPEVFAHLDESYHVERTVRPYQILRRNEAPR